MSDEEIVRQRYSSAILQHHLAGFQIGQGAPTTSPCWAVYPAEGLGQMPLGIGPTPEVAWRNSAATVQKKARSQDAERWVDYLLTQGYQWRDGGDDLVHPDDPQLAARIDPKSGQFLASPKLLEKLAVVMDAQGKPPAT
jgi:hypothetical protein